MSGSRSVTITALLVFLVLGFVDSATGTPPEVVRFHGVISSLGGQPVTDGSYVFRAAIYSHASTGTAVWTSADTTVSVAGGAYTLTLFPATTGELSAAFSESSRFLEITVVSGPGGPVNEVLMPRQEIASVPYAMSTDRAQRLEIGSTGAVPCDANNEGAVRSVDSTSQIEICRGGGWGPIATESGTYSAAVDDGSGGLLCGWNHTLDVVAGGAQDALLCSSLDPAVSCPAGYLALPFCDTNTNGCGQLTSFCVKATSSATFGEHGTLCGFYHSYGGGVGNKVELVTRSLPCGGKDLSVLNDECPTGYTLAKRCDDNASGCGQQVSHCAKTGSSSDPDVSGTLCGLSHLLRSESLYNQSPIATNPVIACEGRDPKVSCPAGYARIAFCDDDSLGCGQAYYSCRQL